MTQERTLAVAVAEVRYAIQYAAMNERWWQHVDTTLVLLQILAGSLALAGAIGAGSAVGAVAGVTMAAVSALQLTLVPLRRSVAFRDARFGFHELNKRAWDMGLRDLDGALEDLRKTAPAGAAWLARPAQNVVEQQMGHAPPFTLNWRERVTAALS